MTIKSRIMIVEDEGVTAMRIQGILEDLGYDITSVEVTGEDAVRKAAEDKPDLILMDIVLRGKIDGIEAADQISSRLNLPVIFITSHSDEKTLDRAKKIGPFGYIVKPFGKHEVRISVEMAFYKYQMEQKLRAQEVKFRSLFNQASDSIFLLSPKKDDLIIDDANEAACLMHGYTRDEMVGKSISVFDTPETRQRIPESLHLLMTGQPLQVEATHVRKDGSTFPIEISAQLIHVAEKPYILAIDRDITERKIAEKELLERMNLTELNADIGIALTHGETLQKMLQGCTESLVKRLDEMFARIWVFNEAENMLELKASSGYYTDLDGAHSRIPLGKNKIGAIAKERKPQLTNNVLGDPQIINQEWVKKEQVAAFAGHPLTLGNNLLGVMALFSRNQLNENTLKSLESIAGIVALGIQRKIIEDKIRDAVLKDDLTGLLNRRGFFTLSEQQCKLADRTKRLMSLIYIDLDGFKSINDELGHATGDQALIDTANILKKTFRESDIIARIGGDEFAVLLTEPSHSHIKDIIISHIQNNLRAYNEHSSLKYELIFSIGIAVYNPEKACSIGDLLKKADELMYEDKKSHKPEGTVIPSFKEGNPE